MTLKEMRDWTLERAKVAFSQMKKAEEAGDMDIRNYCKGEMEAYSIIHYNLMDMGWLESRLGAVENVLQRLRALGIESIPSEYGEFAKELCEKVPEDGFTALNGEWQLYGIDAYVVWYMGR